ncbi:glycosyltransferase family protein [Methanobacterium paludis]|uniref:Membrane protein, 6-pyruvoyl-tetrahydropterin synthase-related domain protein n=1 Tax=Methanobacterium paludis (strain DSM 25820 / JCM 18151 / SWAN1) TaxID=868131 RepID=F6D700_METPW|nr:6-pyruvoyltetrahydropterin synthase [Methanobacterium paludis]AEG18367.1 Membrane protein, 6-pyruvoyl-tetrahydropterin synthase-related domain protein [Methanobacterium paludis]
MDFEKKQIKNLLWVVPAVIAFFIALIPTLTHPWPFTVDIFYHIHIAEVYSHYGLTLTDPIMGSKISYPPLFSLVIAALGTLLKINYVQVARFLQPVLAFSVVLSVSYVSKKFYGEIAGISAGFLIMSSYLFSRLVSSLPETMALIFVPLVVYFYYKSVMDEKYKYALLSSFLFLLVILTHQATTLILFLVITSIVLVLGILRRKIRFFTSYFVFLALPVIVAALTVVAIWFVSPGFIQQIWMYGLTAVTGYMTTLPNNEPISNLKYVAYLGILLIFAIAGGVVALKRRLNEDILLLVWILVVFLISKSYWFGVNVLSIRLLVHLLIPFSILGGLGLSYLYKDFKKQEFASVKVRSGFLIVVFVVASLFAVTTVTDPNFGVIPKYTNTSDFKTPQIAPPTDSDEGIADWFNKNGDNNSVVISNNYFTIQFLSATTIQPMGSFITSESCIWSAFNKSNLNKFAVGYFVYDKRLINSKNSTKILDTGAYIFNVPKLIPSTAKLVYENKDYKIFRV